MLNISTSGDSHGYGLFGIIQDFPAHFFIDVERLNRALKDRQRVYGRGKRMNLESDHVEILSGLWEGETTGAPLTFFIKNRSTTPPNSASSIPRPGHADFAGMTKYLFKDSRPVTERASARRTAMDTAIGEFFRHSLEILGIRVIAATTAVGEVETQTQDFGEMSVEDHPLLCPDEKSEIEMMKKIDEASRRGYTLGGKVTVIVKGLPVGIGTYTSQRRLTALIANEIFDIPSVKGVCFGDIENSYRENGPLNVDEFESKERRKTNHAGGIEGGMSNGQEIMVNVFVKAVPTQKGALASINMIDGKSSPAPYVRSDTCVVGAIAVIARSKVATALFKEIHAEFSAPTFEEMKERLRLYMEKRR